jgi:hypothetical protein
MILPMKCRAGSTQEQTGKKVASFTKSDKQAGNEISLMIAEKIHES